MGRNSDAKTDAVGDIYTEAKQAILAQLQKRIAIARHKDGEDYKNRLERAIVEAGQMARIEENESIRYVLV